MSNNSPLIILVGASGSGKSSIAKALTDIYGYQEIKTYTTRQPRFAGEDTHIFITIEDYKKSKDHNEIIAETKFDNNYYYTTIEQIMNNDIAIWDIDGVEFFESLNIDREYIVVYIDSPFYIRFLNMIKRGDKIPNACRRIINDYKAFNNKNFIPDIVIRNNNKMSLDTLARTIRKKIFWYNSIDNFFKEW